MPKLNRQNAIHFTHYAVWNRSSLSSRRKKRKYIIYHRRNRKKAGCSSVLNDILHPIKKGPQLIHFFSVFRIISMPFIPRILIISITVFLILDKPRSSSQKAHQNDFSKPLTLTVISFRVGNFKYARGTFHSSGIVYFRLQVHHRTEGKCHEDLLLFQKPCNLFLSTKSKH